MKEGEILALLGKSGSGKTTLLKCIYGLEDLQSGEVFLNGRRVLGPSYKLMPGDEEMRLVSQDYYVLDNHSVEENIFDKLIGLKDDEKRKRADKLLKLLELRSLSNTRARYLSSGQKQRLAIARAIAVIPSLLLLDEPFSNLDKLLCDKLFAFILKEVRKNKTTVILITHLAEEALKFSDRIAIMDKGRILQVGDKWQLYYKPANSKLAGLLGDYTIIHPDDIEKRFRKNYPVKTFVRPDRFKLLNSALNATIRLEVVSCVYNGKCYEVIGETLNERPVMIYSPKALPSGKTYNFLIENAMI